MRAFMKLAACICALCALPAAALAAGAHESSFALTPLHYDPHLRASKAYFIAVAKPGSVIRNSVRITNAGSKTGTAYLYAVDATTGQTSGAVYFDRHVARRDVGAWIKLSAHSVTLAPKKSREVSFVVRVPRGVRPGDHLGGIVAENAAVQAGSSKGALQIRIRHLTITAVTVQVPGPAPVRVDASGVSPGGQHGYQYVYVHLRNVGALATKPVGVLAIANSAGKRIAVRRLRLDTFLPRTSIAYPVLLPAKALPAGAYVATLRLTYGSSALGYRRTAGPTKTFTGHFPFTVSNRQYTTVFQGVAPVRQPQTAAASKSTSSSSSQIPLWALLAIFALLAGVATLVVVLVRRWSPRV